MKAEQQTTQLNRGDRAIKRIKRDDVQNAERDKFIDRHEDSLLALLIEKHPERARHFLERLKGSIAYG